MATTWVELPTLQIFKPVLDWAIPVCDSIVRTTVAKIAKTLTIFIADTQSLVPAHVAPIYSLVRTNACSAQIADPKNCKPWPPFRDRPGP